MLSSDNEDDIDDGENYGDDGEDSDFEVNESYIQDILNGSHNDTHGDDLPQVDSDDSGSSNVGGGGDDDDDDDENGPNDDDVAGPSDAIRNDHSGQAVGGLVTTMRPRSQVPTPLRATGAMLPPTTFYNSRRTAVPKLTAPPRLNNVAVGGLKATQHGVGGMVGAVNVARRRMRMRSPSCHNVDSYSVTFTDAKLFSDIKETTVIYPRTK